MGLSVHHYKLVTDQEIQNSFDVWDYTFDPHLLLRRELDEYWTVNKQQVFDKFKNFTFKRTFTEVDFVASFKKQGLDLNDYEWIDCGPVDPAIVKKDQEWFDLFIHKTTQEHFKILDRDHVMVENEYECLLFKEMKSFKNRSKKSFWKHTRLDDWDENGLRPDAIEFVMNEEMLKNALNHFEDNAPIHDWFLDEDEIIQLSW